MSDAAGRPSRYRFSVFEVDFRTNEIRKAGSRLRLGPQPLQVLQALLEHPAELVTRDELRRRLWPEDTFVEFENNLNTAVKRLRTTLGDSADVPRFIETVPRRGYRFLAPVEPIVPFASPDLSATTGVPAVALTPTARAAEAAEPTASSRWPVRGLAGSIGLGVLLLALIPLIAGLRQRPGEPLSSIAILPFENLSADPEQLYLADGTTEVLIAGLAQISELRVISRTSAMRFRGSTLAMPEIAAQLGVEGIVTGSVTRAADRVRITARLIDARADRHLWADAYEGSLGELLTLQDRVARAVAQELRFGRALPGAAPASRSAPIDPRVQEAYLRARHFWNQRTAEGLTLAIAQYREALAIEPRFALAHAGLADAYILMPRYGQEKIAGSFLRAKEHALAALEIDPRLPEAHVALAKVQHVLDWNWSGAETTFRRAIELRPGYATAHHWYSILLLSIGRVEEGIAAARRARDLDPLSPTIALHLAWSLFYDDRLEEAQGFIQRVVELQPGLANARHLDGWVQLRRGDADASRVAFTEALTLSGGSQEHLAGLAAAAVATGQPHLARQIQADLEAALGDTELSGQPLFWTAVALGDTDAAFRMIERDFVNRSVCFYLYDLANHWYLAGLRDDQRLHALFQNAGLNPGVLNAGGRGGPAR